MKIELVAELLDKRVLDCNGRMIGSVDSIVLEVDGRGAPRVDGIEIGAPALLRRLHPRIARWGRRLPVTRLPLSKLSLADNDVQADVDAERHSTLLLIEKWLRAHIVEHIPGNGR